MIKAVVFDLDETLINSKDSLIVYFKKMYQHLGLPYPSEKEELLYTAPEKGFLKSLFQDEETLVKARKFRDGFSVRDHLNSISLKEYAKETLQTLDGHYRMAVATNRGNTTESVLNHFGIAAYFEMVVYSRTLEHPKPHPVVLETIMQKLESDKSNTIMVGDSGVDVQTAASVGIPCVIVGINAKNGLGDYRLENLKGLPDLLKQL